MGGPALRAGHPVFTLRFAVAGQVGYLHRGGKVNQFRISLFSRGEFMPSRFGLKSLAAASAIALVANVASADVFNGPGGDIPDNLPAGLSTQITVPAGFGPLTFNSVALNFGTGTA